MPARFVETRDVPLDQLTRFPGNARRGNVAEIRKSIRANGQYRSLVVRQDEEGRLVILAGNHTYDALSAEGHPTARCEVIECSEREARKINLADNRLSDLAVDDNDALVELLSYLDGDYDGTGFVQEDIDFLLGAGHDDAGNEDVDGAADDLAKAGWPVIKVAVPPELMDRWKKLMTEGHEAWVEDHERVGLVVSLAERAKESGLHLDA